MLKIREKYSNKIEQRLGNYLMKELSDEFHYCRDIK